MPKRARRLRFAMLATVGCTAVLTSCSSGTSPSTLSPQGPGSARIAGLWWFMFWISAVVIAVVVALVLVGVAPGRRRRARLEETDTPRWAGRLVTVGGVIVPVVVLAVLWVLTLHDMSALSQPSRPATLRVDVIGHRWWWEVRYPSQGIVTANDIHIPTGQPVRIVLTSVDVNHSFWVPQLMGKTDLIPGVTNTMWIQADRAGVYRGQCAEYCGLQHAQMIFFVVADPPPAFQQWLDTEAQPATAAPGSTAAEGQQVFETAPCASCHTIRGTTAGGTLGPDLTHFGARLSIGAGARPNTPGDLGGWIVNSQSIKPGNLMPPMQLSPQQLQTLITYLESLK